jgi:hypothetical protein
MRGWWMDRWVSEWIDGWMNRGVGEWVNGWMDRQMDALMEWRVVHGYIDWVHR